MTTRMDELQARPVIDVGAAVDKLFEGAMELLEGTRRLMEEYPKTEHARWDHSEHFREGLNYFEHHDTEQWKKWEAAWDESKQMFPDTVTGSGGDDTWFDYHPCDLSAVSSIIDLALKVIGTDEWAGPPKPEVANAMIKPLLTEWFQTADINDPASQVGNIVPYLQRWAKKYDIDLTNVDAATTLADEEEYEDSDTE